MQLQIRYKGQHLQVYDDCVKVCMFNRIVMKRDIVGTDFELDSRLTKDPILVPEIATEKYGGNISVLNNKRKRKRQRKQWDSETNRSDLFMKDSGLISQGLILEKLICVRGSNAKARKKCGGNKRTVCALCPINCRWYVIGLYEYRSKKPLAVYRCSHRVWSHSVTRCLMVGIVRFSSITTRANMMNDFAVSSAFR